MSRKGLKHEVEEGTRQDCGEGGRPAAGGLPTTAAERTVRRALSVAEAAAFLGVTPVTLWAEIRRGTLVAHRVGRKAVRLLPRDFNRFLSATVIVGPKVKG